MPFWTSPMSSAVVTTGSHPISRHRRSGRSLGPGDPHRADHAGAVDAAVAVRVHRVRQVPPVVVLRARIDLTRPVPGVGPPTQPPEPAQAAPGPAMSARYRRSRI